MTVESLQDPVNGESEGEPISFAEFLMFARPYLMTSVSDLCASEIDHAGGSRRVTRLSRPLLTLHCDHAVCGGQRIFSNYERHDLDRKKHFHFFVEYRCRNCTNPKLFALTGKIEEEGSSGQVMKIGELPAFGPPVPTRLSALVGPDRELFFKGRRAESQGMGIGAFAYYRRVVENQKTRILDEILKVAKNMNVSEDQIRKLEAARDETQLTKALDSVRDALPQGLQIFGKNPITLLYKPLSAGLHAESDETCLQRASDIRLVLEELADRLAQLLRSEAELKAAVDRLSEPN